ncbi:phosphomannomutase/phosphoglucomutase [Brevirhabdus sp.]|uniref:phosphomannomutase/phosphoglucomutase n=1 Tax=Brevirhabdus sp. TaxID=2004514 RepID=UPI0040596A1E
MSDPKLNDLSDAAPPVPLAQVTADSWDFLDYPMIAPSGFREYDARWRYPAQINLQGFIALGLGIGTQMHRARIAPRILVGNDFREYAPAVKHALMLGLQQAGIAVTDIGTCVTPMAYFAQIRLGIAAVAMVTASHNPNGWTGVKLGFAAPLTHGVEQMRELRDIVMQGGARARAGGQITRGPALRTAYLADAARGLRLTRPLRIVCATGNGTASHFAPELLETLGAQVVPLHTRPDFSFPHYNPNPESLVMLRDMGAQVNRSGADLGIGFDGDGDRCGVVDHRGREIFADKLGLILARDIALRHPGAHFVTDVKSTGLFASDPVLRRAGATVEYWKTGHSHMKRRVQETGALAGFEKSGHFILAPPLGHGFDCAFRATAELCALLNRHPGRSIADLYAELPETWCSPTLSPACPDCEKYGVTRRIAEKLAARMAAGEGLAGRAIVDINRVNGARVSLTDGSWVLVRASSNTPNLVVVCESTQSRADLKALFEAIDALLRHEPEVGPYDQSL